MLFQKLYLSCSILLLTSSWAFSQQQASNLQVTHRHGQSFLTWDEINSPGYKYNIYRSLNPITVPADLASADLLGEVGDTTSINHRWDVADPPGAPHYWTVPTLTGDSQLSELDGLFVHTCEQNQDAYYAITAIRGSNEITVINPGSNSTTAAVTETAQLPQPVFQGMIGDFRHEVWSHWVGDRTLPYEYPVTLLPSQGYSFMVVLPVASGSHGLALRLHAAGGHFAGGAFPSDNDLPDDMAALNPEDGIFVDGTPYITFWFGTHDGFPAAATASNVIIPYTLQRVWYELEWTMQYLSSNLDTDRVYVSGRSLGGIGTALLTTERPELFAAATGFAALYDFAADDIGDNDKAQIEHRYGAPADNLPVQDSNMGVFDFLNFAERAEDPSVHWPMYQTSQGKGDLKIGWSGPKLFYEGTETGRKPSSHYFDEGGHQSPCHGQWGGEGLANLLAVRMFEHSQARPLLFFSEFSLDDEPGEPDPTNCTKKGALNGYLTFDPLTATEGADFAEYQISLRASGPDAAPTNPGEVRLIPRRLRQFQIQPGEFVHFTLTSLDGLTLFEDRLLLADANGQVQTSLVDVDLSPRIARFERFTVPANPYLFASSTLLPGELIQFVAFGNIGDAMTMYLSFDKLDIPAGTQYGPWWLAAPFFGFPLLPLTQSFEIIELTTPDDPALSGISVHSQFLVGNNLTNLGTAIFR